MKRRLCRGISLLFLFFGLFWLAACGGGGGGGGGGGAAPTPVLSVSPVNMAFTTTAPDNPAAQALTIGNTGAASTSLTWTASESLAWLSLNKTTGTLAGGVSDNSILASADITGMTAGSYSGAITVTAEGQTETISVTLTINAAPTPTPLLGISTATMTFTAPAESGANPAAQNLTISNSGDAGTTVDWTLTEDLAWLTASTTTGSVAAGQSSIVILSVDVAGLTKGTYNGTVTVSAPGQTDKTLAVQLTIGAALTSNPSSENFTTTAGTNPASKDFMLANASSTAVSWTATSNQQWLTVSPASGSLAAGGQANNLKLNVNSQSLAAGTYSATVTIASGTAGVSGLTIPVTLTVNAAAVQSANVFVGGTAGITQLSSLVGAKAVSKAAAATPTVLADAKVTITVTKTDGSKSVTSTRTNAQGSYSANVTAVSGDTIIVSIEKEGFTTFTKTTKVGANSQLTVSGNVAQAVTQVVTANQDGVFKAGGGTGPGFRFGLMRARSGARTPFASASGVRKAADGSVPDLDISIPQSWAPGATALTTRLASFDPNDPGDRQMFPGEFVGVGGGSAAVAKADTTEYALESVAFFQSKVTPNSGQPLAPTQATGASKAAAEPTIIFKWIPRDGCEAIKKYADRDGDPANGVQVPIYTYNPNSGKWGYLGEGTLKTFNGSSYDTVDAATVTGTGNLLSGLLCTEVEYYFEIVATEWYTWWNLDYPLLFNQPTCISGTVVDNVGDPIPGAYVVADGRTYFYTYADQNGTFELALGDSDTVSDYTFTAHNYSNWGSQPADFTNPVRSVQLNPGACTDIGDVVIPDLLSCRITGKLLEETATGDQPFAGTWVEAYNTAYTYYNWAETKADGTFTLKSTCNDPITLQAWGQSIPVNVNGTPVGSELSDDPATKTVKLKDLRKANSAPQVDTWIWPNPAKEGRPVDLEAWAWDFEGDYPLTFAWTVTDAASASVGASTLQWFSWTPAAAGTYTATVTVTDSKGKSTVKSQAIAVNEATNTPPVIWWAGAEPSATCGGFPVIYVYAYDPDGDDLTYSFSAGSPVDDPTLDGYVLTEEVTGTLTVTASDGKTSVQSPVMIPAAGGLNLVYADNWPANPVAGGTVELYAYAWQTDGNLPTYAWSVIGPDQQAVTPVPFYTGDDSYVTFTAAAAGTYDVTLTVTGSCPGDSLTQNFQVVVSPLSLAANLTFLQYRTYEDATKNHFQAWVDYKDNGLPVSEYELAGSQFFDPNGTVLSSTPTFYSADFLVANWDAATSQFTQIAPRSDSGYSFDLTGNSALPTGSYRVETDLYNGGRIVTDVNFLGQVAVPVVASASMTALWNADGSLTLSWSEPGSPADEYRLIFYPQGSNQMIFNGRIPYGVGQVTIPASLVQQVLANAGLATTSPITWQVQTRNYDANNRNDARGYSNQVLLPAPPAPSGNVNVIIR